jgi:serine/threonine protein kinase
MSTDRTPRDPLIGRLFAGRFQIEKRVGTGGMGNIYKAMQVDMKRPVALKLLHPDLGGDPEMVGRFDREMRATTRIEHPNSVRVYEYGQADGMFFLAMELLDGRPLADVISDDAPMPPERAAHIGLQIAQALAAAHAEKIIHRDLKPENIMLVDRYGQKDFVKVLDFGLSRFMDGGGEPEDESRPALTQTGVRVGTPLYMAPEYVSHFAFDHRSDLYALGIILYEMAVGQPPFTGRPYEILDKHVATPPPRPSTVCKTVPDWLDSLILKLLEKEPNQRPRDAMAVYHALDRGRAQSISQPGVDLEEVRQAVAAAAPQPAIPADDPAPEPTSPPVDISKMAKARSGKTAPQKVADIRARTREVETLPPLPGPPASPARRKATGGTARGAGLAFAGCGAVTVISIGAVVLAGALAASVIFFYFR